MTRHSKLTVILAVQLAIVALVLGVMIFRPGDWTTARWIGLCIAVPAAVLFAVARYQLGASFSVTAQARELVTTGIYSRIRNPIYVFGSVFILGVVISLQVSAAWVLLAIIPVQVIRARKEAKVLEETFGDAYREYRAKTWF